MEVILCFGVSVLLVLVYHIFLASFSTLNQESGGDNARTYRAHNAEEVTEYGDGDLRPLEPEIPLTPGFSPRTTGDSKKRSKRTQHHQNNQTEDSLRRTNSCLEAAKEKDKSIYKKLSSI